MTLSDSRLSFYEFFAGGGMARIGLGPRWRCLFANDLDRKKADAYAANLGDEDFLVADVWDVDSLDLPGEADLAWASFPCQDISLAGRREGLMGKRTSSFYGFWRLMEALREEGRAPHAIVLENVTGVLTSNGGRDFRTIAELLAKASYRYGALEVDAAAFVPQSRPRLFLIAVLGELPPPRPLFDTPAEAREPAFGRSDAVRAAAARLTGDLADRWLWWRLPTPPTRNTALADLLERHPPDEVWHDEEKTTRLLDLMEPRHRARVDAALASGRFEVGAVFRRTRVEKGKRVQRAEVRFDGMAGCLRTPAGGSSRQFLLICEDGEVRSRTLTPRETARLMGLQDDYMLPAAATNALRLTGDGVAPPAVAWLAEHLLEPLIEAARDRQAPALTAAE
ncbi:MAG: DNA cytosine methyltransferase [Caulobacterales bacterium]|nr:DNA cytosine methyltransferase [Caulobacterales bacterium]